MVKRLPAVRETWVRSWVPGWEDPLEKGMATHSSTLAWKIPWTEEPAGLYSPWGHKESDTTQQLGLINYSQDNAEVFWKERIIRQVHISCST